MAGQLNIHLSPELSVHLERLMQKRRIATKAEAVRVAVREALARSCDAEASRDYGSWIGLAGKARRRGVRFKNHAALWDFAADAKGSVP